MENWWSDPEWEDRDLLLFLVVVVLLLLLLLLLHWHTANASFRMTALVSFLFCFLPQSLDTIDYSQYRLATLILVFPLFFFHLVFPEMFALPSHHHTFSPDCQPREE
jgi:hypothetical protein